MKTCRDCGRSKPMDQFYKHAKMGDGTLNKCMDCVRERVRKHRAANLEKIREYDRRRGYRVYDESKVAARRDVHLALARGELTVKPCEKCGYGIGVHAHHEDYGKPLDVNWLCRACHAERHREINAANRRRTA